MDKKRVVIIALIVIILILAYLFWPKKETAVQEDMIYSNYPPDWVEPLTETHDNKNTKINVAEATEGFGDFIVDQERYVDVDNKIISLFYGGSYNGEVFNNIYYDLNDNIKMRIWDNMNPNDGIIEGFGLFKKENDNFVLYLFVDDDWKKQSNGNINIIWGNNITDKGNLNSKKFDFSNEKDGVYIDKITQEVSWFAEQNPVVGRLFFGELSLDDVKSSNYQKTFIALT